MHRQYTGEARSTPVIAVRGGIAEVDDEQFHDAPNDEIDADQPGEDSEDSTHLITSCLATVRAHAAADFRDPPPPPT